ncbi:MAG TPA: M28 family peptidase [Thermoanaerobaculia bacterium]|nr:M28 family peptidase [Thermoanaerobaculia bacterium]HUM28578.1 M28 family peptidase [Thermoanaerobaculia bacterium]HXK66814.1 M28 family peptidase [Thermoanaerobaculia bacterium]
MLSLYLAFSLLSILHPQTDHLKSHVTFLADDRLEGRFPGTEGSRIAAEYIEDHLRDAGLEPGFGESYLQPFSFISGVELEEGNSLTFSGQSGDFTLELESQFRPVSFSSSGEVEGPLLFAGYGISAEDLNHDDYSGLDANEKIVIILRDSPDGDRIDTPFEPFRSLRYKAFNALAHGAAAVIITNPPQQDDDLEMLRHDFSPSDAGIPIVLVRRQDLLPILINQAPSAFRDAWESASPLDLPGLRAKLSVHLKTTQCTTENIAGFLRGTGDKTIILAAHYDHLGHGEMNSTDESSGAIHNGADDNASGVSLLLELAKTFSCPSELPVNLLFLFPGAEEEGTLGASHFINHLPIPRDSVLAMINIDMVGNLFDGKLIVQGVGSSPDWITLVPSVLRASGLDSTLYYGGFGASDHAVFYGEDIPVLFFFTGTHERYHSSRDDAEFLDYRGMERILNTIRDTLIAISVLEPLPVFQVVPEALEEKRASRGRLKVYLGTIPDFASGEDAFRLGGVKQGGPAEKAGLKKGDIILRFGTFPVRNIYDFTFALQNYHPGDQVSILILRDGETMTISAVLEERTP